jgi:DNA-binding NtrC family response regulator
MRRLLFADRFLSAGPARAFDLASADWVTLRVLPAAPRPEVEAWSRRCDGLLTISHHALVGLVDFGLVGPTDRFEAWAGLEPRMAWNRRDSATRSALVGVVACLASRGMAAGRLQWSSVVEIDGRPALLPDQETGMPLEEPAGPAVGGRAPRHSIAARQMARLARLLAACEPQPRSARSARPADRPVPARTGSFALGAAVDQLAEVLDSGVAGRPRSIRLAVPAGDQAIVARRVIARLARLRGYVPVAGRLMQGDATRAPAGWQEAIDSRHAIVVHTDGAGAGDDEAAALLFLALGVGSERPHVLLTVEETGGGGMRVPPERTLTTPPVCVREQTAGYSPEAAEAGTSPRTLPFGQRLETMAWPDRSRSGSVRPNPATLAGLDAARRGRHALAERLLREGLGRHRRRQDEGAAGEAAVALGQLLLIRGRPVAALGAFDSARGHFERARRAESAIQAAVFTGLAATDVGRWHEAESALRAARISAHQLSLAGAESAAALALARCLLWQGRPDDARSCLDAAVPSEPPPTSEQVRERPCLASDGFAPAGEHAIGASIGAVDLLVSRACLAVRIGVATGDLAAAGRAAAAARKRAAEVGGATDVATACCAGAAVYGAIGDLDGVRRLVHEGTDAARRAHAPLRVLRLRIQLARSLVEAGRGSEARALLARLSRLDAARLPVVLRVPIDELLRRGDGRPVAGCVQSGPSPVGRPSLTGAPAGPGLRPDVVDCVLDLLRLCQSTEDDERVLCGVAATLRSRIQAVSLACVGVEHDVTSVLAVDGAATAPESVARRAIAAGVAVSPDASGSGLEAAVPVRFAGAIVGAIACRWAADVAADWARSGALLAAAAAAIAPSVRATLDRRACPRAVPDEGAGDLVGVSEAVRMLRSEVARAAQAPFNVVVEGESGSGKELVARALHRLGPRRHRALCALNCAALSDELAEAELFGHARGAFTGAVAERKGLFEEADHGTLVLDEVGELTARTQAKLLRAIQEGEIRRVGENAARAVDVRIVAATNRPLRPAVDAGLFRQDLLYRLEVIRIVVPPLRARVDDIPILAVHFWGKATERLGSRATLAPTTLAALARYDWPGNVRELQNVMAALAVAAGRRGSVGPERLPGVIARRAAEDPALSLEDARRVFEARFVRAALARAGGRRGLAARELGLTRQGLSKLMARVGIE